MTDEPGGRIKRTRQHLDPKQQAQLFRVLDQRLEHVSPGVVKYKNPEDSDAKLAAECGIPVDAVQYRREKAYGKLETARPVLRAIPDDVKQAIAELHARFDELQPILASLKDELIKLGLSRRLDDGNVQAGVPGPEGFNITDADASRERAQGIGIEQPADLMEERRVPRA